MANIYDTIAFDQEIINSMPEYKPRKYDRVLKQDQVAELNKISEKVMEMEKVNAKRDIVEKNDTKKNTLEPDFQIVLILIIILVISNLYQIYINTKLLWFHEMQMYRSKP